MANLFSSERIGSMRTTTIFALGLLMNSSFAVADPAWRIDFFSGSKCEKKTLIASLDGPQVVKTCREFSKMHSLQTTIIQSYRKDMGDGTLDGTRCTEMKQATKVTFMKACISLFRVDHS